MACYARDPIRQLTADFSLTGYADDMLKKVLRKVANLDGWKLQVMRAQCLLGERAEPLSYSQNAEKTVVIPVFCGPGVTTQLRQLRNVDQWGSMV